MTKAPISAIIPFYGDPAETMVLVDALRRQTLPVTEIIVADDASPTPFPAQDDLIVVRAEHNGGFGTNCNAGARAASAELLLFLNSDLEVSETFIAELYEAARAHMPALVTPVLREEGRRIATARRFPTVFSLAMTWLTPLARWRDTPLWRRLVGHYEPDRLPSGGVEVDSVIGACMLVPRDTFFQVGGFDERFYMNSEEIDLQHRLGTAGVPSVVLTHVVVDHVGGGSSDPTKRRGWLTEGFFIYFHKRGRARRLKRALTVVTQVNYLWNRMRQARGVAVDAAATRQFERQLIAEGWAGRRGRHDPKRQMA